MRRWQIVAVAVTLTAGAAQPALVASLESAGPFGQGQPEPLFVLPHHRVLDAREVGTGGHVRVRLRSGDGGVINAIAFRAAGQPLGQALQRAIGGVLHVAGTLSIDRWGGSERVQMRIVDVADPA